MKTQPKEQKTNKPLSAKAQKLYKGLKSSLSDIKKWENGEIGLKDAKDFLKEF